MTLLCEMTTCAMVLSGCAWLNTRPGHPDSYGPYQQTDCKTGNLCYPGQEAPWPTSRPNSSDASDSAAPPVYRATDAPYAIWQARGVAWNKHLQYRAAAFKAGDVEDWATLPIFGAAIAAAAAGIANVGTAGVAGAGLGGAAVGAGYSYLHPDKDKTTDDQAAYELLCVVDESKPLTYISVVPLILDRAALQDALDQLNADAEPLLNEGSPNATEKQAQGAVQSAQQAAKSALTDLSNAIGVYNTLPTTIYSTIDQIDQTARVAGARTLDYNTVLASLQQSSTHTNNTNQTKNSVKSAKAKAGSLTSTVGASPRISAIAAVTKPKPIAGPAAVTDTTPKQNTNLAHVTTPVEGGADATNDGSAKADTTDKGTSPSGTNETKAESLAKALNSSETNDLQKVNQLADDAEADIPTPNFSAIQADIAAAPAATATTGCITPSKSTVGTKTTADSP